MKLNDLTALIIKAAINVHKELGPGLLESVYQRCMVIEIESMGLSVEAEVPVPVVFKGRQVHNEGFRMDLLVENRVIVELKSKETNAPVDKKQLVTYLRLTDMQAGLLINFNEAILKNGITRLVNGLAEGNELQPSRLS